MAIRVDSINRKEHRAVEGMCTIEPVSPCCALRRNSRLALSGFAMSCVLASAAAAQQSPQMPFAATALENTPAPSPSLEQNPAQRAGAGEPAGRPTLLNPAAGHRDGDQK